MRIECYVDAACVFVFVENFFPGLSAIGGAENPALRVRAVWMSQRRYEHDVRIRRIDDDLADGARIAQPNILPGLAAIQGSINSVAVGNVSADAGLSRANVQYVVVGTCHRDAPECRRSFFVENWRPCRRAVG